MNYADLSVEQTTNLIALGLREELRVQLRKRLEEEARDLIEAACRKAVDRVMSNVESYRALHELKTHIHFNFDVKESK